MSLELLSTFVPSPFTIRGVSTKLTSSKDGSKLAYGSGRTAVILSLASPPLPPILFPHPQNVTCVSISPSGYYAASGDTSGTIKIFPLDGPLNQLPTIKFEAKPLQKINDIAWDGESKRFMVVGEGREGFGAVYSFETGASIGTVGGHNKSVNSVSMKPGRPFKAVTGSDDATVCFHTGVPFKFESQSRKHSRFVQAVDYSHDGLLFVSAGSDGKLFLYEGLKGEELAEFVDGEVAHKGTIFAASFSRDSKTIATSSADGSCKLWDVESKKLLQTWTFSEGSTSIENQQVGNCFAGTFIVTLSFSGVLNMLEPGKEKPLRTIFGHQTSITTLALSPSSSNFYTGDASGTIRQYDQSGICSAVPGSSGHSSRIVSIIPVPEVGLATASYDDSVKFIKEDGSGFGGASISTGSLPKALATSKSALFLVTAKDLQSYNPLTNKSLSSLPITYPATSIAVTSNGSIVAVGAEDCKVYLYESESGGSLKFLGTCELRNPVTAVAFSIDQASLACGESTGKILLFDVKTRELLLSRWVHQSARIQSLAWHSSGNYIASGSLDQSIFIYSTLKPSEVISVKNVHAGGVAQIVFSSNDELLSTGADSTIKKFSVKLAL